MSYACWYLWYHETVYRRKYAFYCLSSELLCSLFICCTICFSLRLDTTWTQTHSLHILQNTVLEMDSSRSYTKIDQRVCAFKTNSDFDALHVVYLLGEPNANSFDFAFWCDFVRQAVVRWNLARWKCVRFYRMEHSLRYFLSMMRLAWWQCAMCSTRMNRDYTLDCVCVCVRARSKGNTIQTWCVFFMKF